MSDSRFLVLAAALTLASATTGCGAETSPTREDFATPTDEDDIVKGTKGEATGEGTIDGTKFTLVDGGADSLTQLKDGSEVTLSGVELELSSSAGMCTAFKKNAHTLRFHVQNNAGVLAGNTYKIGTNEDSDQFSSASYRRSDSKCQSRDAAVMAKSGNVKITRATTQTIAGEYEFSFGAADKVKGTFSVPTCLKTLRNSKADVKCN